MKYLWTVLFICLFATPDAFCADYNFGYPSQGQTIGLSDSIRNAWGYPVWDSTFILDRNEGPGNFRIKEGYACCTSLSTKQITDIYMYNYTYDDATIKKKIYSSDDDQAIIAFSAREVYEHGGRFCLTQFHVGSSTTQLFLYKQQPNWPGMRCMTLCEPGWDGPNCQSKTSEDSPCDSTDIAAEIKRVQKYKYRDNDAIAYSRWRMAVDHQYFTGGFVHNHYPHYIILGASDFYQHGVVAQPVLMGAAGVHPVPTVLHTAPAGGKIKKLCAQGFTKNENCDISSKNCAADIWCSGYSNANLKSDIHEKQRNSYCNVIVCKDGTKALDSDFKCVDYDGYKNGRCDIAGNDLFGRLVKCENGKIFNAKTCTCDTARSVSQEIMQYGLSGRNAIVADQCWTKESAGDFKNCVLGIKTE